MRRTRRPGDHGVTAALSGRDRQRLLERVAQLGDLAELMKQPGTLAEPDEPVPLHRTSRTTERTTSS
jgi:hypothetical protein